MKNKMLLKKIGGDETQYRMNFNGANGDNVVFHNEILFTADFDFEFTFLFSAYASSFAPLFRGTSTRIMFSATVLLIQTAGGTIQPAYALQLNTEYVMRFQRDALDNITLTINGDVVNAGVLGGTLAITNLGNDLGSRYLTGYIKSFKGETVEYPCNEGNGIYIYPKLLGNFGTFNQFNTEMDVVYADTNVWEEISVL